LPTRLDSIFDAVVRLRFRRRSSGTSGRWRCSGGPEDAEVLAKRFSDGHRDDYER
jgi:hypothetical protein